MRSLSWGQVVPRCGHCPRLGFYQGCPGQTQGLGEQRQAGLGVRRGRKPEPEGLDLPGSVALWATGLPDGLC